MKLQGKRTILNFFIRNPSIPRISNASAIQTEEQNEEQTGLNRMPKDEEAGAILSLKMEEEPKQKIESSEDDEMTQREIEADYQQQEGNQCQRGNSSRLVQDHENPISISDLKKPDQRKFFSGRKPKALKKILAESMSNIHFQGLLGVYEK